LVVQELTIVRTAIVLYGHKVVHWNDLLVAISIFKDSLEAVIDGYREYPSHFKLDKERLQVEEAMGATTLINALTHLLHKDKNGAALDQRLGLEYLVSTLVSFDVTDPRDTIYALLAIAWDDPQDELKPSQKKTLLQAYTEFLRHCVQKSKSLNMICCHWAPSRTILPPAANKPLERLTNKKTALPSWIRQLNDPAFGTPEKIFQGWRDADGLFGDLRQHNYNASDPNKAEVAIFGTRPLRTIHDQTVTPARTEVFDGTLTVKGFVLGSIKSLSPHIISGMIPQEALEIGGWGYSLKGVDLLTDIVPSRH